jgi:parallel beta-helix repeat protein
MLKLLLLVLGGWAVLVPATANATQYFVAPGGSDAAAGSEAAPWRSLQHAADVIGPGDRVAVRPGSYTGFYLATSGTASAPIEFTAEPGVIITQRNATTPDGINLERASYVVLDGFSVTGMPRAGVRTVGSSSVPARFVTVRNVHAYDNARWGIFTGFVDDLLIESNIASGSVIEHGIYVSNSGDRPVVRDNVIFGNRAAGIHMNGDVNQGGDGIISNALISGNRIYDNGLGGASGINMDGVQDARIENNLLYNNHASGISLYRVNGAEPSTGNVVVNNTVLQASNGRWALNVQNGSSGNTALNNILLSEHAYRGAIDVSADSLLGFASDFNVVISRFTTDGGSSVLSLGQWQAQSGNDLHSMVGSQEELFVDAADGDYHLRATASAVDAGSSLLAPPMDLDGGLRPIGGAVDIGADELGPPGLPGDYNGNGWVGAADFVLWRSALGRIVPRFSGADGDGSGEVGPGDYAVWRANFGATPPMVAAPAPEPGTLVLLLLGLLGGAIELFCGRRLWPSISCKSSIGGDPLGTRCISSQPARTSDIGSTCG